MSPLAPFKVLPLDKVNPPLFVDEAAPALDDSTSAGIADSPKPPPEIITLTMKVFDELSRNIYSVGAGGPEASILEDIFENKIRTMKDYGGNMECVVQMKPLSKQKYLCGSIRPKGGLYYITDTSGAESVEFRNQCCSL